LLPPSQVEGAEEVVLAASPGVLDELQLAMVEMDGNNRDKDERVHRRLEAAGLARTRKLFTLESGVYLRVGLAEMPVLADLESSSDARNHSKGAAWRSERRAYAVSPSREVPPRVLFAAARFLDAYAGPLDAGKRKGYRQRIALVWAFLKALFEVLEPK